MIFPEGEFVKMVIETYPDDKFNEGDKLEAIDVLINPESFKESYSISYKEDQPANSSGTAQKFNHIKPGEFTLKLLLDSTGIFKEYKENYVEQLTSLVPFLDVDETTDIGISEDVEKFKKALFEMNGKTHDTNFIKITYAKLVVQCKIKKVDINYKLFNPQGYPIRAEISITCINTINEVLRKIKEEKESPDLTHIRTVKEGDTLPFMTYNIYGDAKYYLEVARVNNLLNFRNLVPGQEIFFPPLDKTKN